MEAAGVEYHPFVISCWGRFHDDAEQMLQRLAKRMARREPSGSLRGILIRLRARLVTEVMRRAARMVLACLPSGEPAKVSEAAPCDGAPPSVAASLRAGHPGLCVLPPLYPAPRIGGAVEA